MYGMGMGMGMGHWVKGGTGGLELGVSRGKGAVCRVRWKGCLNLAVKTA